MLITFEEQYYKRLESTYPWLKVTHADTPLIDTKQNLLHLANKSAVRTTIVPLWQVVVYRALPMQRAVWYIFLWSCIVSAIDPPWHHSTLFLFFPVATSPQRTRYPLSLKSLAFKNSTMKFEKISPSKTWKHVLLFVEAGIVTQVTF